jgi:hypothetical protein
MSARQLLEQNDHFLQRSGPSLAKLLLHELEDLILQAFIFAYYFPPHILDRAQIHIWIVVDKLFQNGFWRIGIHGRVTPTRRPTQLSHAGGTSKEHGDSKITVRTVIKWRQARHHGSELRLTEV